MTEIVVIATDNIWELQDELAQLPGVVESAVGYAGGTTAAPSYHNQGDHVMALRVSFDTHTIGYEDILRHALTYHYGPESAVTIFYTDPREHSAGQLVVDQLQQRGEVNRQVNLKLLTNFFVGEDYQQHYLARLRGEYRKQDQ